MYLFYIPTLLVDAKPSQPDFRTLVARADEKSRVPPLSLKVFMDEAVAVINPLPAQELYRRFPRILLHDTKPSL